MARIYPRDVLNALKDFLSSSGGINHIDNVPHFAK